MPPDSRREATPPGTHDPTQPPEALCMTPIYYKIDRRHISLLRFILEAYEGVATLTTIDARVGIVKVLMAPGRESLVADLMAALCESREILMEPLPAAPSDSPGDP